jgi:uroporphyrinogen decarboxylase
MKFSAVIWDIAPFLPNVMGVDIYNYYQNIELKLSTQIEFQKRFPDALLYPGLWADFGTVVEASAFGCEVIWPEADAPYVRSIIDRLTQVKTLRIPDPYNDGLMPRALREYEYMNSHVDRTYKDYYGYLKGVAYTMGPLETAGLIAGYELLFTGMLDQPAAIHDLVDKVTGGILRWIHAQERYNGPIERLFVADHVPSQISRDLFREFGLPALQKVFGEFQQTKTRLWHNEGRVDHLRDCLDEIGCNVFHCGDDIHLLMQASKKITFMGNIAPLNVLLNGTSKDVRREVCKLWDKVPDRNRLLISTAGGMAPGTPLENVETFINTAIELSEGSR